MDSGNSGSLQSSSGGDDEFDAACVAGADSSSPLSALLRQPPSPSVPGFGGGSSLIYGLQELGTPPLSHWCSTTAPLPPAGSGASPPSLPCHGGVAASAADRAASAIAAQPAVTAAPPRGSRKRARASRRAPTTVLTTDTSNFRAMVQEFTGIPAPPFAGASAARSRFDHIFPSLSSSAAALPQYLLRPFAHKLQAYPPPFTSPSTSSPAPANVAMAASTAAPGTTAGASGDNYQQHLTTAASSSLLRMQDHNNGNYLSFQSTLSAQLDGGDAKYPLFDRGLAPSSGSRLQDPTGFLGLAHGTMSSEGTHAHLHPRNGDRGDELSGLVGGAGASVTGPGGCKATYSSVPPLLEPNGRSPPAGVSTATTTTTTTVAATAAMRTQGVDSWVCTSE